MKRILFSFAGTVVGLVALLSFKSQGHPLRAAGPLPSAGLPTSSSTPQSGAGTTTSAPPRPGSTSSAAAASRTITGQAIETQYGIVQVQVVVAGSKIKHVSFVQLTAYDGRSQEINQSAAPILLQQTLSAQTAQIDGVSGATYTSQGYVQSLQSALDQVGLR